MLFERNLDTYKSISTNFNLKIYNALDLKINSIPFTVVFSPLLTIAMVGQDLAGAFSK